MTVASSRPRRLARFLTLAGAALVGVLPAHPAEASAHAGNRPARATDIVLVHGFTDTAAVFDGLVGVLESHGYHCFAPSLSPKNFRYGVHDLTLKLAVRIDEHFGRSRRFVMIGQSMGGLIVRDYVQNMHRGRRVQAFFMIATANHGTLLANLSPGGGVRDFAVGNPFLRALNADLSAWKDIPVYAYWTPFDLVVIPSTNEKCSFGTTKRILAPFHQCMARNRELMADIAAKIDALAVRPFAPAGNERQSTHRGRPRSQDSRRPAKSAKRR